MYQRPDGLYEKILVINGKRKAFRGKSPQEVTRKILNYKGEIEKGRLFKDVAEEWDKEHCEKVAYTTYRGYNAAYQRAIENFGETRIRDIKINDIDRFIKQVATSRAYKTVQTQLLVLNLIFKKAMFNYDVDTNPVECVSVPKNLPKTKRELPTQDEIEIVKNSLNCTFGLFAYVILYTGCRRGEALALQYKDIDRKNKVIHITKSIYYTPSQPAIKTPKTSAGKREVILLDVLADKIPKGKPDHYLFGGKKPMYKSEVERLLKQYQSETGLTITPHQLRHAYATILYEAGIDEKAAQDLLGHTTIAMTRDIYTHISALKKKDTAQKLNAFTQKIHSNG